MKTLKRNLSCVLVFVLTIMLFTGCSKNGQVTDSSTTTSSNQKVTENSSKTEQTTVSDTNAITVLDQLGRQVEIKGEVNKIVSSYAISTSLLIALGVEDKVVGVEMKSKDKALYKKTANEFTNLPEVGSGKSINVEECAKLAPDLIIIPSKLKEFIPQFEQLNIPVIAIEPETLDAFLECIILIGKAVNAEERASGIVKYYEDTIEKVKQFGTDGAKPNVYLAGSNTVLRTATSKMYQDYMISVSGGNNVTSDLKEGYWADISAEQLLSYNPDIIYIVQYAEYSVEDVLNDIRLKDVNAIKNNKVFVIPSVLEPWDYPTPSSVLGILWMTNNINPEKYTVDEFQKASKDFYKKYFDLDVNNEEIGIGI